MSKPHIAIAGLGSENSTFTPSRTKLEAFHVKRGQEVVDQYDFLKAERPLSEGAEWHGVLTAKALPGGPITPEAFETLAGELIGRLEAIVKMTRLDGLWFDIHGAMNVLGYFDIEAELLRRTRKVIGPDVLVSASMDLHGNVSRELAHQVDLITCYRTAPHIDTLETKERACRNLVGVLRMRDYRGEMVRPIKAWIPLPILLPGEQTSTRDPPGDRIYAAVPEAEKVEGVLDAAIWVGYAWGDEERNCAVVMVTGFNQAAVVSGAERLARMFWDAREEFKFVAPTGSLEECLEAALKSEKIPYYISDSGDNPTGGGSGDVTFTLKRILSHPAFATASGPKVIYASIPGPEAVRIAKEAGIGATVTVTAGAEVDNNHADPVTMTGRVHSLKSGDQWAEEEAVLQVGSVFVITTKLRKPFHKEYDFTNLGLDARHGADIVIVKIGYLEPDLYDMSKDWMLALTPGGVDQDLARLGHKLIRRPMWPFDKVFEQQPDLSARIIPKSNEPLEEVQFLWN